MSNGKKASAPATKDPSAGSKLVVSGRAQLEQAGEPPRDLELVAYAFDPAGHLLGTAPVDAKGNFETELQVALPLPIEIVVAPPGDADTIRRSSLPRAGRGGQRRENLVAGPAEGLRRLLPPVACAAAGGAALSAVPAAQTLSGLRGCTRRGGGLPSPTARTRAPWLPRPPMPAPAARRRAE